MTSNRSANSTSTRKLRCGTCRTSRSCSRAAEDQTGTVRDYIAPSHLRIGIEPDENADADILIGEGWLGGDEPEDFRGAFEECDIGDFAVGDFMLVEAKRAQFSARLDRVARGRFPHRHLLSDRRRDRALPRDHGRRRGRSRGHRTGRRNAPARLHFSRREPRGPFRPRNFSAATRRTDGGGCNARKSSAATAPRSTSASSTKAISSFTSSTASDVFCN